MPISRFAVQYSNMDAAEIAASSFDVVITEAAPLETSLLVLTDQEVADLQAAGKRVVGYVSVGQTEDARPYWNTAWTDDPATTDVVEDDTGPLQPGAPAWLAEVADSWPARMVEYWDQDWKQLVFDAIQDMIDRGYDGVFLDNILTYYELSAKRAASTVDYAQDMVTFVEEISAFAKAQDPNFLIIPNGGGYVLIDAGYYQGSPEAAQYYAAIDAVMAESHYGLLNDTGPDEVSLAAYDAYVANGVDVLALEYSIDQADIDGFVAAAIARGFIPGVSPTQALATLPDDVIPQEIGVTETGTRRADEFLGTEFSDSYDGKAGADDIDGANGDDDLNGGNGSDHIDGGGGGDTIRGAKGRDDILGGFGDDVLFGGNGADYINGGADADRIDGGRGNDDLYGGAGPDIFVFSGRFGYDVIYDFDVTEDLLDITTGRSLKIKDRADGVLLDFKTFEIKLMGVDIADFSTDLIV